MSGCHTLARSAQQPRLRLRRVLRSCSCQQASDGWIQSRCIAKGLRDCSDVFIASDTLTVVTRSKVHGMRTMGMPSRQFICWCGLGEAAATAFALAAWVGHC